MIINVKDIKKLIEKEELKKIVYKYGIDKMVAHGEKITIDNPDPNYEFYIAIGDGYPQKCNSNGRTNCPNEADGTLATFIRKIIGKDHPNAILYVIDYSVHEVKFNVTEKRSITLVDQKRPIEVNYCASGTVKFKYNKILDDDFPSVLSTYIKDEYEANDQLIDGLKDIISKKLKYFANKYGEEFDNASKAYEFYNTKQNDLDNMSVLMNKEISDYQQKKEQKIHRSDVIVTIQAPELNVFIKSEGEKNLQTSETIAEQNRQHDIAVNQQHNAQTLEADQVKYDIDIKKIKAIGDAEVRRIDFIINMFEDEYNLRKKDSEEALKYKYEELYSRLNQNSDRDKMQFELIRMQLENQFKQESQKTDVISGLLTIMAQQQLISDDSIKKIIDICNVLLDNK